MINYRRAKFEGGYYFFTVVTHQRRAFLTDEHARFCLRYVLEETKRQSYFDVVAFCLLPDHLHCVWKLPQGDRNFSLRWSRIKTGFTRRYLRSGGAEYDQNPSRIRKRERGIWHRRFWEHKIRNEKDLQRHVDYIHYNPVKHGLVDLEEDWPWSTCHRYIREGIHPGWPWHDIQAECEKMFVHE
jgi:putative transposase